MKHLYFVRHGQSVMNRDGIFSGLSDTPLTDKGIEQCHAAGLKLQDAGIDCIVASPVHRTMDTARIIAEEIGYDAAKILTNDLFTERDFGPLEGTEFSSTAPLDHTEGVEHSDDLRGRIKQGLEYLRGLDADTILVVSHGAVGRALDSIINDLPFHDTQRIGNANITKLL